MMTPLTTQSRLGMLILFFATHAASREAQNKSENEMYRFGYSFVHTVHSEASPTPTTVGGGTSRTYEDPAGVQVHENITDVSSESWLNTASARERCYTHTMRYCYRAHVCGTRCEPILLRVRVNCAPCEGASCSKHCFAARKYNRCFAKICFRRVLVSSISTRRKAPSSFEAKDTFAIVRYRRPLPRYELHARRNRQTATQSAIFR